MPKSENQKLKILYVAKYLLENSDENNYVRTVDIVDYLVTECDISAERRSIYRDINILRDVFRYGYSKRTQKQIQTDVKEI